MIPRGLNDPLRFEEHCPRVGRSAATVAGGGGPRAKTLGGFGKTLGKTWEKCWENEETYG